MRNTYNERDVSECLADINFQVDRINDWLVATENHVSWKEEKQNEKCHQHTHDDCQYHVQNPENNMCQLDSCNLSFSWNNRLICTVKNNQLKFGFFRLKE